LTAPEAAGKNHPSVPKLRFDEIDRVEMAARAPEALLVIPIGATEQHGPHLPTGTDTLHAAHIAESAALRAAEQIDVIVAPTLPFGSSDHHLPFGATLSLGTDTLYRMLVELGRSAVASGFQSLFLLNGHGGNHETAQLAARDLALQLPCDVAAGSWWAMAYEELAAAGAADGGRLPGHAGRFETAVVASLKPELLAAAPAPHPSFVPSDPHSYSGPHRVELHGAWRLIDGYTDDPGAAEAEDGRRWLDIAIGVVAEAFVDFLGAAATAGPTQTR
jgi:creatinine amidohydrolase